MQPLVGVDLGEGACGRPAMGHIKNVDALAPRSPTVGCQ